MWSVQTQNQGFDAPDKIRAGVSMNDLRRKEIRRALALVGGPSPQALGPSTQPAISTDRYCDVDCTIKQRLAEGQPMTEEKPTLEAGQ
jgi:hypothetical protein